MAIRRFLSKLKRKPKAWPGAAYQVDLVYIDKAGRRYYMMKDLMQLPHRRFVAAQVATRIADYCLTAEVLETMIADMRTYANKGDIVALFSVLEEMDRRRRYAAEEETLLNLASIYSFVEGEKIETIDQTLQDKKKEWWLADADALSFFLQLAWQSTRKYATSSIDDIEVYLTELRKLRDKYQSGWGKKLRSTLPK